MQQQLGGSFLLSDRSWELSDRLNGMSHSFHRQSDHFGVLGQLGETLL
ncbi:hypothetical protein [Laspinema palackyanum]|nr:hypothetical protein [Laspinema sp. D2c]